MTNFEKIKNMSIEEMERECNDMWMCEGCPYHIMTQDFCILRVKQWLESEAEK